jgi:hypothetical protein
MLGFRAFSIASILMATTSGAAPSSNLLIYESRRASATTEGDVVIATDPETAYRTATDYRRWASIFPSVREVIVRSCIGDDARVTFIHVDGTRDDLHFRNRPATHTVWFEQTNGDAQIHAEIAFLAGDQPSSTHVHSRLYADVHGLASLFVSDGELRSLRQQTVRQDLLDLRAFFQKLRR